jgi:hypothetical protein
MEELSPEELKAVAEAKAAIARIFGPDVPVDKAFLTVLFKDGTEKSYDLKSGPFYTD